MSFDLYDYQKAYLYGRSMGKTTSMLPMIRTYVDPGHRKQDGSYFHPWMHQDKLKPLVSIILPKNATSKYNHQETDEVREWLRDHRCKYKTQWVYENGAILKKVFVFKNAKHAILFKLVWG